MNLNEAILELNEHGYILENATVTNQFKQEFDALLKKYGAKVKGSCWSAYDPAQGNVWVEIEGGDDLDLMDLDDHGEYKAE